MNKQMKKMCMQMIKIIKMKMKKIKMIKAKFSKVTQSSSMEMTKKIKIVYGTLLPEKMKIASMI